MARLLNYGAETVTWDVFDAFNGSQSGGFTNDTGSDMSRAAYVHGFYSNGFDLGVNSSELYGGSRYRFREVGGGGVAPMYLWYDELGAFLCQVKVVNSLYIEFFNGATTWQSTKTITLNTWYWLEWHLVLSDTVGVFQLKVNGDLYLDLSNIDTKQSTSNFCRMFYIMGGGTGATSVDTDDLVINDTTGAGPLSNRSWPGEVVVTLLDLNADTAVADWTGSGMSGSPGAYATEVLADSPKLFLKLNETSGTSAADSSGLGHNGTYGAGATLNQPGTTGDPPAVALDGTISTGYVEVANHADLNPTAALTVEVWVKGFYAFPSGDSLLVAKDGQYRLTYDGGSNGLLKWVVWVGAAQQVLTWTAFLSTGSSPYDLRSDNGWHHIVGTFDDALDVQSLYVDGVLRATRTQAGPLSTTTNVLRLGRGSGGAGNVNSVAGYWDECAVYATALSTARVELHHKAGKAVYELLNDNDLIGLAGNHLLSGNEDLEYITTNAAAKKALYDHIDVDGRFPTVQSMTLWYAARKSIPSPTSVAAIIKRAGVEVAGTTQAVGLSTHVYRHTFDRDTTDTTDWSPSKANAMDVGVKTV